MTQHDDRRAWRLVRRVLPQHTDHAGVMWHGAYLAWLEEARVEALASAGLAYSDLSARGLELPVVSLAIDYRQALLQAPAHAEARRGLTKSLLEQTRYAEAAALLRDVH